MAHEEEIAHFRRCAKLSEWACERNLDLTALRSLGSNLAGREVFRGSISEPDTCVIIKVSSLRKGRGPFPPDVPPDVERFYAEVLFLCPDCGLCVEREAEGQPLSEIPESGVKAAARSVGVGLAKFHAASASDTRRRRGRKLIKRLMRHLTTIRDSGLTAEPLPQISELETRLAILPALRIDEVWIHGDLKPEHVFITSEGLRLIDSEGLRRGFPIEDIANLINHLDWHDAFRPSSTAAFLRGYVQDGHLPGAPWLDLARLSSCLRTIRNRLVAVPERSEVLEEPLATLAQVWRDLEFQLSPGGSSSSLRAMPD